MSGYFEHRVVVDVDNLTLVGDVHFSTYLGWQGECRNAFLRAHAPAVPAEGLRLHTIRAECEFFADLALDDVVSIRMRLEELTRTQLQFTFDFVRLRGEEEYLVARGRQRVGCVARLGLVERQIPAHLRQALLPFVETPVPA